MEEMKTMTGNQNTAPSGGGQLVQSVPASPYVAGVEVNRYAEQVPSTVKRFRENFAIFGTSALLFGICFTACFFRARIGISYPVFVLAAIALIQFVGVNLRSIRESSEAAQTQGDELREKSGNGIAVPYYLAAATISASVVFTAKASMHFFSTVAIILLLEVAFLELLFAGTKEERNFEERCREALLLPFVAIANCMTGLLDGFGFLRRMKFFRNEKVRHILLGVLIAIPLLIVVLALLTSADMIFSSWTEKALDFVFFSSNPYLACLLTIVIYAVAYGIMAAASRMMAPKQIAVPSAGVQGNTEALQGKKNSNALTAITVTLLLTLVYLLFCGIQLYFLFGGGNISLPAGFTYAEYARQGFFQLLAVTVLNILILMFCRKTAGESGVLRVVLTVFSACTYIMIASAMMRMLLYIDAYNLSFLRILVLWFLGLNTLLVTGIILAIYRAKFPLFRYFVAVTAVCYIVLAYANVDYIIASYNLRTKESARTADMDYLTNLSEDAARILIPALNEILEAEQVGTCELETVSPIQYVYTDASSEQKYVIKRSLSNYVVGITQPAKKDFRSWNFARHIARKEAEKCGMEKEDRMQIYFTNYSDESVFSVEYSSSYESSGMMNADNTPLSRGDMVTLVDDFRSRFNESGKVYVYDRDFNVIYYTELSAEMLSGGPVYVELYSDPYGELYCTINH